MFCSDCLRKCLCCPQCKGSVNESDLLSPMKLVFRYLKELRVICNYCNSEINREYYKNHFDNVCLVQCEFCKNHFSRNDLSNHECPLQIVSCRSSKCNYTSTRDTIKDHQDKCSFFILEKFSVEEKIDFMINFTQNELKSNQNLLEIIKNDFQIAQERMNNVEASLQRDLDQHNEAVHSSFDCSKCNRQFKKTRRFGST